MLLQQVGRISIPLPFDSACARTFRLVAASLRSRGRKVTARAYDALIAATALADLPLYTANPVDFDGVPGLDIARGRAWGLITVCIVGSFCRTLFWSSGYGH